MSADAVSGLEKPFSDGDRVVQKPGKGDFTGVCKVETIFFDMSEGDGEWKITLCGLEGEYPAADFDAAPPMACSFR